MTTQPTRILFATDQPLQLATIRKAIRLTDLNADPIALRPRAAFATLRAHDACLFFVDAKRAPSASLLTQAVNGAPKTRFILSGTAITPEMLRMAFETGIHGVLSTSLPLEETADAISRIWNGERQFRFDCGPTRTIAPIPPPIALPAPLTIPAASDFDSAWMFGHPA